MTLLVLLCVAIIAFVAYRVWQHVDDMVSLWTAATNYTAASWNDFYDGMTGWGLVAVALFAIIGSLVGLLIGWVGGHSLADREVKEAKAAVDRARQETARERDRARRAEEAAAQDRETAKRAEMYQYNAERRAQGLQGQLDKAVMLADDRGKQLRDMRRKNRERKALLPKD